MVAGHMVSPEDFVRFMCRREGRLGAQKTVCPERKKKTSLW